LERGRTEASVASQFAATEKMSFLDSTELNYPLGNASQLITRIAQWFSTKASCIFASLQQGFGHEHDDIKLNTLIIHDKLMRCSLHTCTKLREVVGFNKVLLS